MTLSFDLVQRQIGEAMLVDRFDLQQRLRRARQALQEGRPDQRSERQLTEKLSRSLALVEARKGRLPTVTYPDELPVSQRREEIGQAIRERQVVVVCGETGSGKSTQLPKICLEMGRGVGGLIGHTQPRRIAARSVASRVASELNSTLGDLVGFKIRFTDKTDSAKTLVKVMTDGVLLAETQRDRFLERYDTIIIDEAHERSLNIDFLLGLLKRLLPRRPDLRVIITSATIDASRFADHFADRHGPAPIIQVEGRAYPVDVLYRPIGGEDEESDVYGAIADAAEEAAAMMRGDMLVFLPTERDIREAARVLRGRRFKGDDVRGTEILPLYSRLSAQQQNRIFELRGQRRIVLSTNVAESSITVPNIRFVIDVGTARISRYSPRSKVQRLPIEPVSRASADQRKGRCGRVGPGICIRLFSEEDYLSRDAYTTPEIQRTNLAAVILQTLSLRLGSIDQFPFLDAPRPEKVRDGYKTLFEIGAIDEENRLTEIGRRLSRLPVDPRIGRMILAGADEGCLHEVLIIAAALEVQDPRERPVEKRTAADEQHAKFQHERSDFFGFLNIWDFFHQQRERLSHSRLRKACQQNFLSFQRMREWLDVHRQLMQLIEPLGMKPERRDDDYGAVHRALLTGLLSSVALRADKHEFTGAGGLKLHLWPGSGLFRKNPNWVVAAEMLETTRRYLRTAAQIDAAWIEPIAEHLIKRSYSDPHWRAKRGEAMAYEKVTLFGMPIAARRPTPLAPIDPEQARELLIREGLVEGQVRTRARFFVQNQKLLEEIEQEGAMSRKRDLVVEPWVQERFYEQRLPESVVDLASLHHWIRERGAENRLIMLREDLIPVEPNAVDPTLFPPTLATQAMSLELSYQFEPGSVDDGVTLNVPKEALGRLNQRQLGWLVPGLLEEKILTLIRTLPKSLRRNFVPAPDVASKISQQLLSERADADFYATLASALSDYCGEPIRAEDLIESKLPQHLRMNIRVVDEKGGPLHSGRDLGEIQRQFDAVSTAGAPLEDNRLDEQWRRDGLTKWEFESIPDQVQIRRGSVDLLFYPTIIDQGDCVSLRLLESREASRSWNRGGLRRLFCIAERKELRSQAAWLPNSDRLFVYGAALPDGAEIRDRVAELIGDRAFFSQQGEPRSEEDFQAWRKYGRAEIGIATQDVSAVVKPLFENYQAARLALETVSPRFADVVTDIRRQLQWLTTTGFLVLTPWQWLKQMPRYMRGISSRLEKLKGGGEGRDARGCDELTLPLDRLQQLIETHDGPVGYAWLNPQEIEYRWMVEEFRVSLFAQELGTYASVSAKRLDKIWTKIELGS